MGSRERTASRTRGGRREIQGLSHPRLLPLLERIAATLRCLGEEGSDEAALLVDLRELKAQLDALRSALEERYARCLDLDRKTGTDGGRRRFLEALKEDDALREETGRALGELKALLESAAGSSEVLYKITSSRGRLGRLQDPRRGKDLSQLLTASAIAHEKIARFREALEALLEKLVARGLEPAAELPASALGPEPERPGADPVPPQRAGGEGCGGAAGEGEEARSLEEGGADLAGGGTRVAPEELREVVAGLNRRARLRPLVPAGLGNRVRFTDACRCAALRLRVRILWGERGSDVARRPWRGEELPPLRAPRLWDLPASPPQGILPGREPARPVPGTERLVVCPRCRGSGRRRWGPCPRCEGSGKLVEYRTSRTRYRREAWRRAAAPRGVRIRGLWKLGCEEVVEESFTAVEEGQVEPGLGEACLDWAAARTDELELRGRLERFLAPPGTGSGGVERRLVRVEVRLERVPCLELRCETRRERGRPVERFRVWLCGTERRLAALGVPRVWTARASVGVAALFGAGAALGWWVAAMVV